VRHDTITWAGALALGGLTLSGLAATGCGGAARPPDARALVADLKSPDAARSGEARLKLISLGEPSVPALVELLHSEEPRERLLAATTFWGMGPRARSAAGDLADALRDADPQVRVTCAMALENMGPAGADAVPSLVGALQDGDRRVRQAAVKALGAIGPAASAALPALTREIKRQSWPEAEEAVRRIRGVSAGAVPADAER
jgi:HEAT repeat protein